MTTFLKRLWATLTALPVYATALTAAVTAGSTWLAGQAPGHAQTITHVGVVVVAVIGFGAWAVTRLTPVAAELRGFPKASLSAKEQALMDTLAALEETRAQVAELEARIAAIPPLTFSSQSPPDTITTPDPAPWKPPSVVAAEQAAATEVTP